MGKRTDSKAVQKSIAAAERRYKMLEYVKGGATNRDIAAIMEVSPALVSREVKRALRDLAAQHSGVAAEVRGLQTERYNTLLKRWFPVALDGDEKATRLVLSILNRLSEIHGIIPDKSLIQIDVASTFLSAKDFDFSIEAASGERGIVDSTATEIETDPD